ncbi:MAG: hypothetical protein VKP57_08795 [Candidatus Sericytochromatia bacterium]|nr:hypothetical protein [Candidatus Sericytochromatia bacterium]
MTRLLLALVMLAAPIPTEAAHAVPQTGTLAATASAISGIAPSPVPKPAARAAAPPTVFETVTVNPARDTLVLTWSGSKPRWRLRRAAPELVHVDLDGKLAPGYTLIRSQTGSPIMRTLAVQVTDKRSRVAMRVMPGMRMVARLDGKRLIVTFDRRALQEFWKIYRSSTFRVGVPDVRPDGTLVVPVRSPLEPTVRVVHADAANAWAEIPADGPIPAKVQQPTTDTLYPYGPYNHLRLGQERWGTVRLTMGLRDGRSFRTVVNRVGVHSWTVVITRTQDVMATPEATPSPASTATADTLPATPSPAPVTAAPTADCPCACPATASAPVAEDPDWDPISRVMGSLGRTGLNENYPEGGVSEAVVRDITTLSLYGRHAMAPWWSLEGDLRVFEDYTLVDRLIPDSTHKRTDVQAQGAALWDLQQGMFRESIGLGYGLRYLTVTHSLTPIAKDFLFSDMQLFQGPFLRGDLSVRPFRPLRLYARGLYQPMTAVLVDPLVDGLPDVRRAYGEVGIEWLQDRWVFRLFQNWNHMWRGTTPFQQLDAAGISAGIRY